MVALILPLNRGRWREAPDGVWLRRQTPPVGYRRHPPLPGEGWYGASMANELARHLRKTMTPEEVKLWVRLREMRAQGLHFRRQVPRAGYIVDFACLLSRLIIEVDGAQHGMPGHLHRDTARDRRLAEAGFKVLRFWNNEVHTNIDGVLETIYAAAHPSPAQGKVAAARSADDGWGVVADRAPPVGCTDTLPVPGRESPPNVTVEP